MRKFKPRKFKLCKFFSVQNFEDVKILILAQGAQNSLRSDAHIDMQLFASTENTSCEGAWQHASGCV